MGVCPPLPHYNFPAASNIDALARGRHHPSLQVVGRASVGWGGGIYFVYGGAATYRKHELGWVQGGPCERHLQLVGARLRQCGIRVADLFLKPVEIRSLHRRTLVEFMFGIEYRFCVEFRLTVILVDEIEFVVHRHATIRLRLQGIAAAGYEAIHHFPFFLSPVQSFKKDGW